MNILTLTTDFGLRDPYIAAFKGSILTEDASINIVDISHGVDAYDITVAARICAQAYPKFPKGSLHVIRLLEYSARTLKYVLAEHNGHFFLAPDNGVLSLIIGELVHGCRGFRISDLRNVDEEIAKRAVSLLQSQSLQQIGEPLLEPKQLLVLLPIINAQSITGNVTYIDYYGNLHTNIDEQTFLKQARGRDYEVLFRREVLTKISSHYGDVPQGEKLCFFNAQGFLEIAVRIGRACDLFAVKVNETVQIRFSAP